MKLYEDKDMISWWVHKYYLAMEANMKREYIPRATSRPDTPRSSMGVTMSRSCIFDSKNTPTIMPVSSQKASLIFSWMRVYSCCILGLAETRQMLKKRVIRYIDFIEICG